MPYIAPEVVHFSGNTYTYTTRRHDSLKISNGKWMWWSQRTGGRSALDYLIKVRGYSFLEAVELLQNGQIFSRFFLYLRMFRWRNSYCCQRKIKMIRK